MYEINCEFSGGNIIVDNFEEELVTLHQDIRDTEGHWFYWYFEINGAQGKTITFEFNDPNVFTVKGAAKSLDKGNTWAWLNNYEEGMTSFTYTFEHDEDRVRFSMGMAYTARDLNHFLDDYRDNPALIQEELCTSNKGRSIEKLRFGCIDKEPAFRALFVVRHHCCEMMSSYALEGIIKETLSDSEAGKWLKDNVEFMAIPFIDKDGVEEGDQGKNRKPFDHNRDYGDEKLYAAPKALREQVPAWSDGKMVFALDMHCPWIRGKFHDVAMFPGRLRDPENWERAEVYLKLLEENQTSPLQFSLAPSLEFVSWGGKVPSPDDPPEPTFANWVRSLPGMKIGLVLELPYGEAAGNEVNQTTARQFGYDLAVALYLWLKQEF